jgi:hypothetical protein
MRIYKYPVVRMSEDPTGTYKIQMIQFADILCAMVMDSNICVWAKVNELLILVENRTIEIFATGETMDQQARRYINSIQDGPFVWHVFVR